ncbi:hypothetical protein B0T17DRAFT_200526 [Bombardia bombarda]|uniref:Uncharacterized protein n=1 Tax=Bombardia bombarda TaxID=252184 RepID=A0AA39X9L5_9PEZI|nr:hypothetical protein B0T17DRAFT_200526 [Bombardia bombarda]
MARIGFQLKSSAFRGRDPGRDEPSRLSYPRSLAPHLSELRVAPQARLGPSGSQAGTSPPRRLSMVSRSLSQHSGRTTSFSTKRVSATRSSPCFMNRMTTSFPVQYSAQRREGGGAEIRHDMCGPAYVPSCSHIFGHSLFDDCSEYSQRLIGYAPPPTLTNRRRGPVVTGQGVRTPPGAPLKMSIFFANQVGFKLSARAVTLLCKPKWGEKGGEYKNRIIRFRILRILRMRGNKSGRNTDFFYHNCCSVLYLHTAGITWLNCRAASQHSTIQHAMPDNLHSSEVHVIQSSVCMCKYVEYYRGLLRSRPPLPRAAATALPSWHLAGFSNGAWG